MLRNLLVAIVALGVVFAVAIQLVPYGRNHANPPVSAEPNWDNPHTRALTAQACFDCHSNETKWPWYSNVAPVSWLVQRDVDRGRRALNFSTWGSGEQEAEHSVRDVQRGRMPPMLYTVMHPEAVLSPVDKQALEQGLAATFGSEGGEGGGQGGGGDREHEGGND